MWNLLDAIRRRVYRQPFMKPINDLGLLGQSVVAALVVLVAVTLGNAPLGVVIVFILGLASRLSIRPTGGPFR